MALNSVFRDVLGKCRRAWLCSPMALDHIQPVDLGDFVFTQPHARSSVLRGDAAEPSGTDAEDF